MFHLTRTGYRLAAVAAAAVLSGPVSGNQAAAAAGSAQRDGSDRKPSLSLKATPPIGFSPLPVHAVAELRGGANDYEEFYCPTVAWDWGDGTISENSEDCEPYVAGKSEIRRRFSADHTYRIGDGYQLRFQIKQKKRTVASSMVVVQVRPGAREGE